jgi:hypothetical protein
MAYKNLVIDICRKLGFYPTKLISKKQTFELNQLLRPIDNGVDLIRIGPSGDGGYLLPNDFGKSEICFSPGVSNNWGFEKDLYEKTGISSVMYDGAVNAPADLTENHKFIKKFIGSSTYNDYISITDILSTELKEHKNIIGQIDIEGFEYDLFSTISIQDLARFNIIVCEFHECERWIQSRYYSEIILPILTKIFSVFDLVHYHPNTVGGVFNYKGITMPKVIELTFHRKNNFKTTTKFRKLPHPLDSDNSINF